jgi:phosphoribosylamine-glycine ligase
MTVVMAAKGYPAPMRKAAEIQRSSVDEAAASGGVEIFHAGT